MKKYFLATSAIVGSLFAFAGQASAQTTITADMHLTYSAISNKGSAGAADKAGSYRGFGKETQLNIRNVGKLSNGAGYAAGFSIEHDGNDRTSTTTAANTQDLSGMFNENVYMDFIFGNTTLTVGADHIQNPDFTYTNLAGFRADPEDILDGVGKGNVGADNLYAGSATSRYSNFGAGIIQDLGIAKVSYYYVPGGTASAETGVATTPTVAAAKDTGETGHEFMARGNLGVKGLDATLFYSTQDSEGATAKDAVGKMVGAKYNFGSITVGAELKRNTTAAALTTESRSGAIGYAINKDLTVAVGLMEAEDKGQGKLTEDTKFLQVGYNLGPVAAGLAYVTADNIGGTQGNEAKGLYFQLSSAF